MECTNFERGRRPGVAAGGDEEGESAGAWGGGDTLEAG